MRLSVIIPAFNDLAAVLNCLNSLQALASRRVEIEFLVQDDNSPNVLFQAAIPQLVASVERNPVNLGFAGNVNRAAQRATGDYLFIVNQDVFGVPGWSEHWDIALLNTFICNPQVGIVAPRLLFPNGSIQSAGGLIDAGLAPYHRCLGYSNPHTPEVSTPRELAWATGAALAIRRNVWDKLGGFDARYRMYFEDAALCLRARELGYLVQYQPACTLIHSVGSTGGSPHFGASARLFKSEWVDTGKLKPDTAGQFVKYW